MPAAYRRLANCDRATVNVVGFRIGADRDAMVESGAWIGCKQVSQAGFCSSVMPNLVPVKPMYNCFLSSCASFRPRVIDEDEGLPRFDLQIGPTREWRILGRLFTFCFDVGRTDFGADVGVVRFVPLSSFFEQ